MRKNFIYSPVTGSIWRIRKDRRYKPHKVAKVDGYGYLRIVFNKKYYKAHRVLWALHYGTAPPPILDHINGIKTDNRICNLREATSRENNSNRRRTREGGLLGAYKERNRWRSKISTKHRKNIHLGYFGTKEEANQAYLKYLEEHILDKL